MAVALASLLRLNRFKVYLAANISNPLVAPFLVALELLVGGWVARGFWYSPTTLARVHMLGLAEDLLLGSVIVGGVLAAASAAITYSLVTRQSMHPALASLIDRAASRYLVSGCASWEMANGKLRGDPVYVGVLQRGILPSEGTLVDCGCGRGLMLALVAAAEELREQAWPANWPNQPSALRLIGIETRPRMVRTARLALGDRATILEADLRSAPLPRGDVFLLFDVIHLMPREDQHALLARIRDALAPEGLLIVREADAAGGWRFLAVRSFNWLTRAAQGQWRRQFHFRTAGEWRAQLTDMGFDVELAPMAAGTPFANVVLYARRTASAGHMEITT